MATDLGSLTRRLLLVVNVVAAVAAASLLIAFYVTPERFGAYDEVAGLVGVPVRGNTGLNFAALAAAALLLFDLLYLFYGRRPTAPLRHISSEAPGGVVKVSRDAVEAGLRAAGEALDEITRLRVSVESGAMKRLVVRAHFMCPDGVSLQEASRLLRGAMSERFGDLVRLPDGGKVDFDIEFVGFAGKLSRKAAEAPSEEAQPEEPAPFRGPQDPIDDEDPFQEVRPS